MYRWSERESQPIDAQIGALEDQVEEHVKSQREKEKEKFYRNMRESMYILKNRFMRKNGGDEWRDND